MNTNSINTSLSDDEYDELGKLLAAPELNGRAMDVSTLEGFLTAVVIGPNMIMPHRWMPLVWDRHAGLTGVPLSDTSAAQRAMELVMRHYNHMATWMAQDPASFEPIFVCGPEWGAAEWCRGFLAGMQLDATAWEPLRAREPAWFAPFTMLGADAGEQQITDHDDGARWTAGVAPAVIAISSYLMAQRLVRPQGASTGANAGGTTMRDTPKVGRNDPCPCGSGKKFKKCCAKG